MKWYWWLLAFAFAVALSLTGGFIGYRMAHGASHSEVILTLVAVIGMVILLAAITAVAFTLASLKMNDNSQALGLPEGSVRAIIALSLLVIFIMLTVCIYTDQTRVTISGVLGPYTADQLKNIPPDQLVGSPVKIPGSPETFTVQRILPKPQVSADLAKQIFTATSTMVISISHYPFG
jgi:hypothetical protein